MDKRKFLQLIEKAQQEHWENLDLSNQSIENFPAELLSIDSLIFLDLSNNKIKTIPEEIKSLANLKSLILSNNSLTEIPNTLGELENLEYINFSSNALVVLPSEIGKLKKLRNLDLSDNNFYNFPTEICYLKNLNELDIQKNSISLLPKNIINLSNLSYLNLSYNNISELPDEIKAVVEHNDVKLILKGNPLAVPPEILDKEDATALINYYFLNYKGAKRAINEVKVNIVGQGSVGKTSLVRRLSDNLFSPTELKTEGISITQMEIESSLPKDTSTDIRESQRVKIRLNMWDYGGQEIMHATHQFFLTKRSLYVLVLDSRLTQEENRVEYWLKIIQSFGASSPILLVGNKIDQHPLDIDRTGLQKKYPNIVGIHETSAATGFGIEELKESIIFQVNRLPHVHDLLPENWFEVKTKLEELGGQSNFITQDKYFELCDENEITDETSQRTLLGLLHDLGIVLHFQDDPRLEALGILNPQWVTNGVYKILNSHMLFQNKGILALSMLDEILNGVDYPRGKRLFIVDMMKKFELCYDVEPDKTFLVPDLLPKDEPRLHFSGLPVFEYVYPVLPSSVITRFIVRFNQNIYSGFVWRTGVLLKIRENIALVKADIEDRKITISIDGLEHTRRDTLSAIRYQLDAIHATIKGLNPQKRIPIPGSPNAEPVEYDYLLMLEREGMETFVVKDDSRLLKVNVRQLLSGVETESSRKNTGGNVTNIYISSGGNVQDAVIIGNKNTVVESNFETLKELSSLWSSIKDAFSNKETSEFHVQSNYLIRFFCNHTSIKVTNESKGLDHVYGVLADASDIIQQLRVRKQFPIIVVGNTSKQFKELVESTNIFIREIEKSSELEDTTAIPFGVFIFINDDVDKSDLIENIYLDDVVTINRNKLESIIQSSLPSKALVDEIVDQIGLAKLNPYIYSGPAPDRIFYGREEEQRTIEEKISGSNYAIVANRKMGKTSLLFKISDKLRAPFKDNLVINLDLQHVFNYTEFYKQLLGLFPRFQDVDNPREDDIPNYLSLNLSKILQSRQPLGKVIILMDEVDELLNYDCLNKEKLFRVFRSLSQTQSIRFVFSGTTILVDRLNSPESPFFNFCEQIIIGRLAKAPSEALVIEPMSKLGIRFLDQTKVVQDILGFTDRHPTLVQYVCAKLVDKVFKEKRTSISTADVVAVLETQSYIDDIFKIIWGDIKSDEKLIIYLTWNMESFTKLELIHLLNKEKIELKNLDNSLRRLEYYSLLSTERDHYKFSYKNFAKYFELFHDVSELIEIEKMEK